MEESGRVQLRLREQPNSHPPTRPFSSVMPPHLLHPSSLQPFNRSPPSNLHQRQPTHRSSFSHAIARFAHGSASFGSAAIAREYAVAASDHRPRRKCALPWGEHLRWEQR